MIEVVFDDILRQPVDAIVNPANREMRHGGGLAATIASAGGPNMVAATHRLAPIKTGEAIITEPGNLPFKAVIHTVGPLWDDGAPRSSRLGPKSPAKEADELLARAHFATLKLAWENDLTSVAFPAVSCGVFHFPVERAAPIAISATRAALKEYSPPIERVVFCLLDEWHFKAFTEALEAD